MARPRTTPEPAVLTDGLRDRIIEFRRVPSDELEVNDRNWRDHPYAQTQAMTELLDTVGIAGAVTAYYSERNGGKLTLIDGHERKSHDAEWPTLILDVTDEEADLLLLTLDPVTALATPDTAALDALLSGIQGTGTVGVEDLLRSLRETAVEESPDGTLRKKKPGEDTSGPPEMELQPFEHYDYVLVLFRSSLDWQQAVDLLGLERAAFTLKDGETRKIGRGRVVEGSKLLGMIQT